MIFWREKSLSPFPTSAWTQILFKCSRQSRLWLGRACYSPIASAHMWGTAFAFFLEVWAINTSVDGKLRGHGEWHPYICFWALFTPGSVDIPIEDHVFCMIMCVYVHWCNSISNPLLFTCVKGTFVILEEGNYFGAEDSRSSWRPCGFWVTHFLHLRAPRLFTDIDNESLQTRNFCSQELSVIKLKPLLTGLIYIFSLLYRISIWA